MPDNRIELAASPISAHRYIGLVVDEHEDTRVMFTGINQGGAYPTQATAVCYHQQRHRAPSWDCDCGFYACTDHNELDAVIADTYCDHPQWLCVAHVTLWGTVIEHEHGVRAEHQRIDSIDVPNCACDNTSVGFSTNTKYRHLVPTCGNCRPVTHRFDDVAAATDVNVVSTGRAAHHNRRNDIPDTPQGVSGTMLATAVVCALVVIAATMRTTQAVGDDNGNYTLVDSWFNDIGLVIFVAVAATVAGGGYLYLRKLVGKPAITARQTLTAAAVAAAAVGSGLLLQQNINSTTLTIEHIANANTAAGIQVVEAGSDPDSKSGTIVTVDTVTLEVCHSTYDFDGRHGVRTSQRCVSVNE